MDNFAIKKGALRLDPFTSRRLQVAPATEFLKVLHFFDTDQPPIVKHRYADTASHRPRPDRQKTQKERGIELTRLPAEILLDICAQLTTLVCLEQLSQTCLHLHRLCTEHQGVIIKRWLLRQLPRSYVKYAMMAFQSRDNRPTSNTELERFFIDFILPSNISAKWFTPETARAIACIGGHAEDLVNAVGGPGVHSHRRLISFSEVRCVVETFLIMDSASFIFYRDEHEKTLLQPLHAGFYSRFWGALTPKEVLTLNAAACYMPILFNEILRAQECPIWEEMLAMEDFVPDPNQKYCGEWMFSQLLGILQLHDMISLPPRSLLHICPMNTFTSWHVRQDLTTIPSMAYSAIIGHIRPRKRSDPIRILPPQEMTPMGWAKMMGLRRDDGVPVFDDCCSACLPYFAPLWDKTRLDRWVRNHGCGRDYNTDVDYDDALDALKLLSLA